MSISAAAQVRTESIRIVVVEDHKVVRGGLCMLLGTRPNLTVVGEAGSAAEAIPLIAREQPDIVLLDLVLDAESGLDLMPEIAEQSEPSRVLVLTGMRESQLHQQCVRLGARGLVHKEAATDMLIKAVERVHAGEVWFDRGLMSNVLDDVLEKKKNGKHADPESERIETLTPRELEVVTLVCEGLRNKQIADRLFISNTTVRHHLTSIFSKLGISDRLGLVIFAYRHGLSKRPT